MPERDKNIEPVKPIKAELKPLLEDFLREPSYQFKLKAFAKIVGYEGDDWEAMIKSLFTVDIDSKEIIFAVEGMYDLFLEYQLERQLRDKEPYKTLIEMDSSAVMRIRELAKKIYNGEEITDSDLEYVFTIPDLDDEEEVEDGQFEEMD